MKAKEEGLAVGESYLFSQKPKKIFPLLFVSYDLYIKGNAGPFSVRGFLLSQSICSLTHWSTKRILMKKVDSKNNNVKL